MATALTYGTFARGLIVISGLTLGACASVPEYEPITPIDSAAHSEATPAAEAAPAAAPQETVPEATPVVEAAPSAASVDDAERQRLTEEYRRNAEAIEPAKAALQQARTYSNMTSDQFRRLRVATETLKKGFAERALADLNKLNEELEVAEILYTVVPGDSLWAISAKDNIYGNPYWWPLIYKNNHAQIQDPDLIYSGQQFRVDVHPLINDVKAAVKHAYDRGAWSLTDAESSDAAFIGK